MERFLLAVDTMGANQVGGGQTLLGTIKIAVLPIAKVFTMCFLGFLMASKYVNILPASGRKLLNGVNKFKPTPTLFYLYFIHCCFSNNTVLIGCFKQPCFLVICAVGVFTFASLFDIFSTWSSCHFTENVGVVISSCLSFSIYYICEIVIGFVVNLAAVCLIAGGLFP